MPGERSGGVLLGGEVVEVEKLFQWQESERDGKCMQMNLKPG
jgi:hypothetical protein